MKTLRFLLAGFIATAFLYACSDEDKIEPEPEPTPNPDPEVQDTNHPAPASVTLGGYSEAALQLSWSEAENATSYTAQLLDMEEGVSYEGASDETSYEFAGLETGTLWYGRVRSEFEDGEHSEWVYVTYSGSTDHAVLVVGEGIVEFDTSLELIRSTSSTLTYAWGFRGDVAADILLSSEVCLYSDASCSTLVVGWTIPEESGLFNSDAGCRFVFSGLDPSKTYYCKVESVSYKGLATEVVEGTTLASGPTVTATEAGSAVAGDVLVAEEFAKVYHGGQLSDFAAAYYVVNENSYRSENIKAEGMDDERCTLAPFNTGEFDVFDGGGVTSGYTEGIGLADWAHTEGTAAGRSGHIKLGGSGAVGGIWTPELNALPEGDSNVSVSFSAKNYITGFDGTGADQGTMVVAAISGADVSEKYIATGGEEVASVAGIDITGTVDGFKTFTVNLTNVTPECRIKIETEANRAFIDDVVVTYLGVTNTEPLETPTNVGFDDTYTSPTELCLTWDEAENAYFYTVKYWADGDEGNAKEVTDITGTSCLLEGLYSGTTYWAQVKACDFNSELDSEYSEAVSETTLEVSGIEVEVVNTTTSTITIRWSMNGGSEESTSKYYYEVGLYTSSDCVDETLFVSWILDDTTIWIPKTYTYVRFTFSDLSANTAYYAMVSTVASETSDDIVVSEPLRITTDAWNYSVTASAAGSAGVGDVLVAEDFSRLVHGGDGAFKAVGISSTNTKYRDEWREPKGKNITDYQKPVNWSTEFNIYTGSNVSEDYTNATGLGEWCMGQGTNLSTRPGYAKVGGGNAYGYLATPELSAIPDGKTATVRVDYAMLPYYEDLSVDSTTGELKTNMYSSNMMVGVYDNVVLADGYRQQVAEWTTTADDATPVSYDIVQVKHDDEEDVNNYCNQPFFVYESTLTNVTNTSRIRFSSDTMNQEASGNRTRFMLDYVVITITDLQERLFK